MNLLNSSDSELDCVIVGHYETGFAFHEEMLRSKGTELGDYRNLRMDYITLDGKRMSFMDALNSLLGSEYHWTEMPQVAPVYLCSYLLRRGFKAEFTSFFKGKKEELHDYLRRARAVAVTTTLYTNPNVANLVVSYIRSIRPDIHIILGGPLVDNLHFHLTDASFRYTLDYIGADTYVLERTGERTLVEILSRLKSNTSLSKVRNCFIRIDRGFVFTGKELEVVQMDEDAIDWNLFAHKSLGPTLQTRTALGCPFRCTFCDFPERAGGEFTSQSIEVVEKELHQIQARENVENVVFIDDTFNVPLKRFKEILRMIVRNKFTFRWFSYLRCNVVDEELAELMQKSGCAGVFLGIESGDPDVLRNMKKMASPDQYRQGIKHLHDAGIVSFASLIMGFPGETEQSVQNTIDLIKDTKPTFFRGESWFYNHRSPIHRERERFAIDGNGYKWNHSTMDWEQACDMVLKLFKEGSSASTWLPMYDMDFWILPYLRGKGMDFNEIKTFIGLCGQLLKDEIGVGSDSNTDRGAIESRIKDYSRELALQ